MVVLDHYESDMFKMSNNHLVDNFKNSDMGKTLLRQLIGHPKTGIDTRNVDTNLRFFYSQVPRQNKYTKAYLKPRVAELNKSFETMMALIRQYQPDIMVCYGSWFKQRLVKEYKLKKDQAEPVHLVTDDIDTYVSFCPSPHKLKLMGSNERDQILIQNRMINRFLKGNGIESLKPEMGNYELITDFNKAKEILTKTVYSYPIVAVDFETNTLETYLPGAKAIMISLSWEEHQGISIPIDHRLAPDLWTDEQKQAIIGWIKDLMQSKQLKVLHNCIYDIHMLMDIYDLDKATNCVDTLMMYYETVDESQGALRGLKHLAYIYTNMGGYEDTRDQAFEQYLQDHYDHWLEVEMEKYKNGERKDKPSHRNYNAPTNPVDGAKQDFEWLPMEVLYTYAAADTDVTLQLYNIFAKNVHKRPKWHKLIYDFYPKLCDVLAYLQHNGFQIDQDKLAKYDEHFTKDITELTKKMNQSIPEIQEYNEHRLAQLRKREAIKKIKPADRTPEEKQYFKDYAKLNGNDPNSGLPKYKFNPSSGEKIAYVLYEMMGYQLPAEKEYLNPKAVEQRKLSKPETITWKDYKVDKNAALPYLVKEYDEPLAKMLLQYSNDKKMITGVINGYGKLLDPKGRMHPSFRPAGTATSRLASSNPLVV